MINVNNLSKTYNKGKHNSYKALKDINISLNDTGFYVIFGKSGAGKTTFMNAIGGLDKFDGGNIEVCGETFTSIISDKCRINNIGYIFQNYCLNPTENVYNNVAFGLRTIGITDEELIFNRVMTALTNVGMKKYFKRDVTTLSGGQQQRISIARAMAKGCNIILADEPTGNLDEENTQVVMNLLKEMSKTRLVIVVTHEEDIVKDYADKIIEIKDGQIVSKIDGKNQTYNKEEKNNIYLKDLSKKEQIVDGITIESYGENIKDVNIKIINKDGKLYLASSNSNITFLDNNSEIKLLNTTKIKHQEKLNKNIKVKVKELSNITPGKNNKVFTFKNCFKKASKGSKKFILNNVILNTIIIGLMTAIIILSGVWGTSFKKYKDNTINYEGEYINVNATFDNYNDILNVLNNDDTVFSYRLEPNNANYSASNFDDGRLGILQVRCNLPHFKSDVYDKIANIGTKLNTRILDKNIITSSNIISGQDQKDDVLVSKGFVLSFLHNYQKDETNNVKLNKDKLLSEIVGAKIVINSNLSFRICGVVDYDKSAMYLSNLQQNMYYKYVKNFSVGIVESSDNFKDYVIYKNTDEIKDDILVNLSGEKITLKIEKYSNLNDLNLSQQEKEIKINNNICVTKNTYNKIKNIINLFSEQPKFCVYVDKLNNYNNLCNKLKEIPNNKIINSLEQTSKLKYWEKEDIIEQSLITTGLYISLMLVCCLLIFVNMIERKKEIGIYKAIGVSKKSILFKYFVENLKNIIIPTIIAIFIIGIIITIIPQYIYFWWQFLINLIILPIFIILINLWAVNRYAKKTPAQILSDYDL